MSPSRLASSFGPKQLSRRPPVSRVTFESARCDCYQDERRSRESTSIPESTRHERSGEQSHCHPARHDPAGESNEKFNGTSRRCLRVGRSSTSFSRMNRLMLRRIRVVPVVFVRLRMPRTRLGRRQIDVHQAIILERSRVARITSRRRDSGRDCVGPNCERPNVQDPLPVGVGHCFAERLRGIRAQYLAYNCTTEKGTAVPLKVGRLVLV